MEKKITIASDAMSCMADVGMMYDKFWAIVHAIERFCNVLVFFGTSPSITAIDPQVGKFAVYGESVAKYVLSVIASFDEKTKNEMLRAAGAAAAESPADPYAVKLLAAAHEREMKDLRGANKYDRAAFEAAHYGLVGSDAIRDVIFVKAALEPYKGNFSKDGEFHGGFILEQATATFEPVKCGADLKVFYGNIVRGDLENAKKTLMLFLRKIYGYSSDVHREFLKPELNSDAVAKIVNDALEKLSHIQELSQCREAFSYIRESMGMFKTNFNAYYIDSLRSRSFSIIFENFISDIIKNITSKSKAADDGEEHGASAASAAASPASAAAGTTPSEKPRRKMIAIASQLGKIVSYYRKSVNASGSSGKQRANAQLQKMFSTFDSVASMFETTK